MLDGVMRRVIARPLDALAARAVAAGTTADRITLAGLVLAVSCCVMTASGLFWVALALLAINRLLDGLDGAVARRTGMTDFGGLLDISCDFVFYAAVPVGFALHDGSNGLAACVLVASFYINAATFLGFAALAAKRGLTDAPRGPKALYFTTGLAEGTETIACFAAMLFWPAWFVPLAYGFAVLCLATATARMMLARATFTVDNGSDSTA